MFAIPPDNPLADPPPTQTSVESYPQQIVLQQLSSPQRLDLSSFESDVDSLLAEQEFRRFLDYYNPSAPHYPGTLGFGVAVLADAEVGTTPPLSPLDCGSDYSTVGPLTPSSDYDAIGPDAKSYQYMEVPFDSTEGLNTTSGTPSETFEDRKGAFGMHADLVPTTFCPLSSPPAPSGYGQQLWQQGNSAAAAGVCSPSPSYDNLVIDTSTTASFAMANHWEETASHGVSWSNTTDPNENCGGYGTGMNPSLLDVQQAGYHFPEYFPYDQEQPRVQHYDAAPAGAIGLGGGMRLFGDHDELEVPSSPMLSLPTTEAGSCSPPPHYDELTEHASKGCANVASKKPAARKEKRKQPTTKVFPCLWPGCLASFARSNNLTVHHNGVHLKKRVHVCPFTGCPKALAGYSRKFDRDVHVRKRHPAEGPTKGPTNHGGRNQK